MDPRTLKMSIIEEFQFQYEAADAFDIHESRLSKVLRGREHLKPDEVVRVEAVLAARRAARDPFKWMNKR